jgi:hypothetical protein
MHGHYLVEWTAKIMVFLDVKPCSLVRVNVLEGYVFISLVLKLEAEQNSLKRWIYLPNYTARRPIIISFI